MRVAGEGGHVERSLLESRKCILLDARLQVSEVRVPSSQSYIADADKQKKRQVLHRLGNTLLILELKFSRYYSSSVAVLILPADFSLLCSVCIISNWVCCSAAPCSDIY